MYVIAAAIYPGGSGMDKTSIRYNWTENYWCNLLSKQAINGQINRARPLAMTAMIILILSLSAFWILFSELGRVKKNHSFLIKAAGIISLITSLLLLTDVDHDLAVNTSCSFGFIAIVGTIVGLHKLKWKSLFLFGLFNLLLIALNNYLYHSGQMTYLPIVQKFTFLSFLTWFCWIDLKLYYKERIDKQIRES